MAPQPDQSPAPAVNGTTAEEHPPIGPPSGLSVIRTQYSSEQSLRQMLKNIGYDEAREDTLRLKGVQLIDTVRQSLQLPVRTFDTAAIYYHKFRMRFPSHEYAYEDVALASLFVACKAEDTIKKSKEILCAAHNLRQPHDHKTPDDKVFEPQTRVIIGLERYILETIGFDFRVQYPQKLLIKMVRKMFPREDASQQEEGKQFLRVAYDMAIDIYKTFAPIKQTSFTLVLAILELTSLLLDTDAEKMRAFKEAASWHSEKAAVFETLLDLLDLYTQFPKSTKIGLRFELKKLMDVKIEINNLMTREKYQRYQGWCDRCAPDPHDTRSLTPSSITSPATNPSLSGTTSVKRKATSTEGTMRFVFDADEARKEKALVDRYFIDEYEEHEIEVEEPIKEPEPRHNSRNTHPPHRGMQGDHGWPGYHRSSRHGLHNDRHRSRRGHGY
ncbi:C-terminal domain kinase-like protein [Thermochaetoides thermophila DSM 1495]|uniref:RNA polymerase II holoenzyme cyclin-like subunit n=1 Tax=Chaetomium thermophilum (strain DSM 1495 / CBS 144.50 / IMI 039719) TaxID=759272 RepID=G0S738_CHATD|nr:C-terminal domain kinase-like protein [Thermochaetoides thermophila DSM 1495]EGS21736.1 C-terminal domain kinase-like protein [Thermochaetoides thermophila DSM 1495]